MRKARGCFLLKYAWELTLRGRPKTASYPSEPLFRTVVRGVVNEDGKERVGRRADASAGQEVPLGVGQPHRDLRTEAASRHRLFGSIRPRLEHRNGRNGDL